jgi:hypothetical protein
MYKRGLLISNVCRADSHSHKVRLEHGSCRPSHQLLASLSLLLARNYVPLSTAAEHGILL